MMGNKILISVSIIVVTIVVSSVILWAIFGQDFSDSERLQNALDDCTKDIDSMSTSGRALENCLNNAYNQYGSAEQKQSWFDGEH